MSQPEPASSGQSVSSMDLGSLANALVVSMIEEEANAPRNLGCLYRGPKLINRLPADCLEAVLERVPKKEWLLHRAVCTKWAQLIESMCRRKAKSLILSWNDFKFTLNHLNERFFFGFNLENFIRISLGKFEGAYNSDLFLDDFLPFLLRLFPRPSRLALIISYLSPENIQYFLTRVFSQWSPRLTTLSIQYESYYADQPFPFSDAINSCLSLKCLDFAQSSWIKDVYPTLLPTFERIEHFSDYKHSDLEFNQCFSHLGHNCTRIWHDYFSSSENFSIWMTKPTLLTNVTHFRICLDKNNVQLLPRLTKLLVSLKVLSLHMYECPNNLLDLLAPISNLVELIFEVVRLEIIERTQQRPTPMAYVRKLKFESLYSAISGDISLDVQRGFFTLLSEYFPNLERLVLRDYYHGNNLNCADFAQFASLFPKLISLEYDEHDSITWKSTKKIIHFK